MGKLNMTPEELAALHARQAKAHAPNTPEATSNDFICGDCAEEFCHHGPRKDATWHNGKCAVCDEIRPVTQVRDFGGLRE